METRHTPAIDELLTLPEFSDARVSPDGDRVVYVTRTADWQRNTYVSQLWLADVEGGSCHQVTFGKHDSYSPRWSPDGHWLAYLSQIEDSAQPAICRLALAEDIEPSSPVPLPTYGWALAWSPDSRFIAYIGPLPAGAEQEKYAERYGNVVITDSADAEAYAKLWLLHLDDGVCHPLKPNQPFHVTGFDWHPDGHRIAFAACPSSQADDWDRGGLYVIDVDTEEIQELPGESVSLPRWSPDGTRLAFSRCGTPSYIASNALCVLDCAEARARDLSAFDDDSYLLDWGAEGLYTLAIHGVHCHMFCVDPESGAVRRLTPDHPPGFAITEGWIGLGCNFSRDFSRSAFVSYDGDHPAEVTVLDTDSGATRRLTTATAAIHDWQLGKAECLHWHSSDDLPVEGILTKPPNFDPEVRHPLVVVIHGGPTHTSFLPPLVDGDHWYCAIPQLAGKGALILQPNYRGSAGYGAEFRTRNVGSLGLSEYLDIVSGVDALIERGWVDAERVGVIGMSHGGYLAAFLATYTDRFRAAVVISGISDWALNYYSTDTSGWMRQYLHAAPWEDPEIYRATSPLTYLPQAKTPTLLLHGKRDDRAPITNAYALYRGLKERGVETRLVVYPEMGHGISKPREFRHLMEEVIAWFETWLW